MSLRELAAKDSMVTVEGEAGGSCEYLIIDPTGVEYPVRGLVGDIGILFDTEGNMISGRVVEASFLLKRVQKEGKNVEPKNGWKIKYTDLAGKKWTLGVSSCSPDRTLGLGRLHLTLELISTVVDHE